MNVTCEDRERILLDGTAEEWLALEEHGTRCPACREELRAWNELSMAAAELRDDRERPELWTRIESSLVKEQRNVEQRASGWKSIFVLGQMPSVLQFGLAATMVLVLTLAGGYLLVDRQKTPAANKTGLLKDAALASVERTEQEYMKAIDRLANEAKPQMESNNSALMASYQEKLVVLDSAIDELRSEAGQNPSNAHLRYQLLAMYQEKEATLREILETKR